MITPDPDRLIRLFSWLSPAFPIGGFAYSQGLETAIAARRVRDAHTLGAWLEGQVHLGQVRTDACFIAIAARAIGNGDARAFHDAGQLCLALQSSGERDAETREQARSFIAAAAAWPVPMPAWLEGALKEPLGLPVAVGALAAAHAIPIKAAVMGFAGAAIAQQVSVGVRLVPLGQSAGLALQARLEPAVAALAHRACDADIDDISSLSYGGDVASMKHEDLEVRIFRS